MVYDVPADLGNAVCIVAPHTAIADFFVGIGYYWYYGIPFKFMIKKEFFKTRFISWSLNRLGAVKVDRGKKNHLVEQMIDMFQKNQNTHLIICPEGTRKKVNHWKKGFYLIAEGANVPILLGFIDYKKRYCGVEKVFYPTGDYEKDLAEIWDYYRSLKVMGKYPEQFNLYDDYSTEGDKK
ncbi:MAG: 1-acyl-sn-glycerol-3-phosphate acyltransferase [Bacteroidales bacterium]|nr:1-acyl-sn-glycerol-3-phosphate acyltransferase [Bacteroidales bacterium]